MVLNASPVSERIKASARGRYEKCSFELLFNAMATRCRILCLSERPLAKEFASILLDWIGSFEARYSRFIPESLISQINCSAGERWVEIDPQTEHLFDVCRDLHFLTRGILDPTALPLAKLWDWKAGRIPDEAAIADALRLVDWRKVQRSPGRIFLPIKGMALDLGGIGKEYAVDYTAQLAISMGIESFLIDFGQDVRVHGRAPEGKPCWHIGLEDPARPGSCWAGLGIPAGAVATSGDYVRRFTVGGKRYGHIIDPRTGRPVSNGGLSVSVFASHCTLAGALSTSAFVLGEREGLALIDSVWTAEGCITTETGRYPSRRFYEYATSEPKHAY